MLIRQFSRFTLVGIVGTAVHYGVLIALVQAAHMPAVPASAVGFVTSAIISYLLNYKLTFASSIDHTHAAPRFLALGTVGLALNCGLVALFNGPLHMHWFVAQLFASAIVLCWNFFSNRHWTFKTR